MNKITHNDHIIELIKGDITLMRTDAIVNAANEYLSHGGGVAGAILRRGGYIIQEESNAWVTKNGIVKTGTAAITRGGKLAAQYVIHAVGPVMGSGDEDAKLLSATKSVLEMAESYQLKSLAFPAISTGIFGYPVERCAHIMLNAVWDYFQQKCSINRVVFCLFDDKTVNAFEKELSHITSIL